MRLLSLSFILLAFFTFLVASLARFEHLQFIHHDPITLFKLSELFLFFSIALALHARPRGGN